MRAVSVLAAQNWQNDRDMEDLLVKTLRGDADESVRLRAARVLVEAKSLTPRALAACRTIVSRDIPDGFPIERSDVVGAVANEALRKHGVPTSLGAPVPAIPAGVQSDSPAKIAFMPTGTGRSAVSKNRTEGGEESQFNEKNAVSYPALRISQPPAAPCACDAKIVVDAPQPAPSFGAKLFGRFTKRDTPAEVVVNVPAESAAVRQAPKVPVAALGWVTQTGGPATSSSSGSPMPTTQPTSVQPVSQSTAVSPLTMPIQTGPLPSLKEVRVELRKEGLKNMGVAELAASVERTPPPATVTASTAPSEAGFFRRWFGTGREPFAEATPVAAAPPAEGGILRRWFGSGSERANDITPVSATAPAEGGIFRRWFGSNRDNVETPQPFQPVQPQGPATWLPARPQ